MTAPDLQQTPLTPGHLHLAVALDGAGWHPAAWREPDAAASGLFSLRHWAGLVAEAEAGLLDFVTFEDALAVQGETPYAVPQQRTDRVQGRLDAVLLASALAPLTRSIGLVPTAVATHTEPFHLAKAIQTLDHVSHGRGGVRVRVSLSPAEAAHVGRRPELIGRGDTLPSDAEIDRLFAEATDWVEVLRRLWDSWEDDAEIRDVATGRFVDRAKLHHIDFVGDFFSVKGPSITPRSPQGQPLVTALAHRATPYRFVAEASDVGFVTPFTDGDVARIVGEVPDLGRDPLLFGDLIVALDDTAASARARLERLDAQAGAPLSSDALVFAGTPSELADLLLSWQRLGLRGFRLRPATVPHDLRQITRRLVPELQRRGAFRSRYGASTLRGLLGLERPTNRYATEPTPAASA